MSNVFVKNPNPPIGLTPSENICFGSLADVTPMVGLVCSRDSSRHQIVPIETRP